MSNFNIKIETTQTLDKFLEALGDDEVRKEIIFKAIKEGASVLHKRTCDELKARWANGYYSAIKGIQLRGDKDYNEVKVSLLAKYKLWWFEKGTRERRTKGSKIVGHHYGKLVGDHYEGKRKYLDRVGKGRRTGKILPLYFFKAAREGSESAITEAIKQSIDTAIKRIYGLNLSTEL